MKIPKSGLEVQVSCFKVTALPAATQPIYKIQIQDLLHGRPDLIKWLWEETHVQEDVGLNSSPRYWIDNFHIN